jgi:hypothetical protein
MSDDSDHTNNALGDLRGDLETFKVDVDGRFDAVDRRFEAIDRRFEAIDRRFDAVGQRFDGVDQRFDEMRRHITESELRLTTEIHELGDLNRTILATLGGRGTRGAS